MKENENFLFMKWYYCLFDYWVKFCRLPVNQPQQQEEWRNPTDTDQEQLLFGNIFLNYILLCCDILVLTIRLLIRSFNCLTVKFVSTKRAPSCLSGSFLSKGLFVKLPRISRLRYWIPFCELTWFFFVITIWV